MNTRRRVRRGLKDAKRTRKCTSRLRNPDQGVLLVGGLQVHDDASSLGGWKSPLARSTLPEGKMFRAGPGQGVAGNQFAVTITPQLPIHEHRDFPGFHAMIPTRSA